MNSRRPVNFVVRRTLEEGEMALSLPEPEAVYPESLFEAEVARLIEAVYNDAFASSRFIHISDSI